LNTVRERASDQFSAMMTCQIELARVARAKKFLHCDKIFAKTCCTIPTISYNYEQVTSVFTHFKLQRVDEGS